MEGDGYTLGGSEMSPGALALKSSHFPLNPPLSSEIILRQSEGELAPILKTIHQLSRLNDLLKTIFPVDMAKHCQVANLSQGKLILSFDNATWASKFYFEKNEYLSKFRTVPEFAGIIHITHTVNPSLFLAPKRKSIETRKLVLSDETKDSLQQLILNSDGKLRENLEKLRTRLR